MQTVAWSRMEQSGLNFCKTHIAYETPYAPPHGKTHLYCGLIVPDMVWIQKDAGWGICIGCQQAYDKEKGREPVKVSIRTGPNNMKIRTTGSAYDGTVEVEVDGKMFIEKPELEYPESIEDVKEAQIFIVKECAIREWNHRLNPTDIRELVRTRHMGVLIWDTDDGWKARIGNYH